MYLTEADLLQLYGEDISTHLESAEIEALVSLVPDKAHRGQSAFVAIEECD